MSVLDWAKHNRSHGQTGFQLGQANCFSSVRTFLAEKITPLTGAVLSENCNVCTKIKYVCANCIPPP